MGTARLIVSFRALLVAAVAVSGPVVAGQHVVTSAYRGVRIVALAPPPDAEFDVPVVGPSQAVKNIAEALALVYAKSPDSAAGIETLKKNGSILIVYDPRYPDRGADMTMVRVALFLPRYFRRRDDTSGKDFIVLMGRHGIKWPIPELAAVLVHELVGHGMQHLAGRLTTLRNRDLECAAYLYEEASYQDLGMDKSSREMVDFRKQLDFFCDDFLRHMRKDDPAGYRLWNVLNPDVPKVFGHFEDYLDALRRTGVMQDAVAFASALDDEKREEIYRDGSPEQQHTIGTWLRLGIGKSPDPKAAGRWFRRAAEQGFTSAQFNLGAMYAKGEGVARNYVKAHMWFTITSAYGNKKGKKGRDIVEKRMSATDISRARELAREWMAKHRK